MQRLIFLLISILAMGSASLAESARGKIVKVLAHYLDQEGRHALSPSLYERDAYQALLRSKPELCSTLRFDVQWKGLRKNNQPFTLRLQVRGSKAHTAEPLVLEKVVRPGFWPTSWAQLQIPEDEFKKLGQVVSWRATLSSGPILVAEQKSFLWHIGAHKIFDMEDLTD